MNYLELLNPKQVKEVNRQFDIYSAGTQEIISELELKNKIAKSIYLNKPLKIKLGLDPSAPDVHLGHTVVLNKLAQFQENGHIVQLIIGDFTGRIGDPTGKSSTRNQLTNQEIEVNAKTYAEQFSKVLDMSKVELYYNSTWLSKLNFEDIIRLAAKITVARLLERNDFEERLNSGKPISLHEFFYPLMQGYDSVALESDVELGGNDQHFNVLMGRHLQEQYLKEKQVILLMPIIEGLDGVEKMSKSKGNYIGVNQSPNEMYGRLMSIPDRLMEKYYRLLTPLTSEEVDELFNNTTLHPRDIKMKLARTIVSLYHGEVESQNAESYFKNVFQKREIPDEIEEVIWTKETTIPIVELLSELKLFQSKSEAKRMIKNGGIRINKRKVNLEEEVINITSGMIVQVGKRKFRKIIL